MLAGERPGMIAGNRDSELHQCHSTSTRTNLLTGTECISFASKGLSAIQAETGTGRKGSFFHGFHAIRDYLVTVEIVDQTAVSG
jgi:hypothetical protein